MINVQHGGPPIFVGVQGDGSKISLMPYALLDRDEAIKLAVLILTMTNASDEEKINAHTKLTQEEG